MLQEQSFQEEQRLAQQQYEGDVQFTYADYEAELQRKIEMELREACGNPLRITIFRLRNEFEGKLKRRFD